MGSCVRVGKQRSPYNYHSSGHDSWVELANSTFHGRKVKPDIHWLLQRNTGIRKSAPVTGNLQPKPGSFLFITGLKDSPKSLCSELLENYSGIG